MPFDQNAWKRAALEHYLAAARIDVPGAEVTALQQAAQAEKDSAGGLKGLADAVKRELAKEAADA